MERRRGHERAGCRALLAAAGLVLVSVVGLAGAPGAGAAEVGDPVPVVTIRAVADGSLLVDGVRPCSEVSSVVIQPGELEVRRSGPTDSELTVLYAAQPSVGGEGDAEPLPGEVTIPSGATAVTIQVNLKSRNQPGPYHEHRSSALTSSLRDGAGYALGDPAAAAITLRFDIAVFECNPAPVQPVGAPAGPATPTSTTPGSTAPAPAAAPSATLPFTGAPITLSLAGVGSGLVGFGALGARYGRPRWKRTRAKRMRARRTRR